MKTISQSKAWTLLAQTWKNPIPTNNEGWLSNIKCIVILNNNTFAGLCDCINRLFLDGQIRESIKERMTTAVRPRGHYFGFKWEPNFKGAKQRVWFCNKMAKLTKRKKRSI